MGEKPVLDPAELLTFNDGDGDEEVEPDPDKADRGSDENPWLRANVHQRPGCSSTHLAPPEEEAVAT